MTKPTLYILCGLPFSGKTTLAKKIAAYMKCTLIGFDSVWKELESELDPKMDKVEEWKFVLNRTHDRIRDLLRKNKSVVYDDINARIEHREALRNIAKECHASSIVLFVNTPLSIIKERERDNKAVQQRHDVEPENFKNALAQFQKPRSVENVMEYTPQTDTTLWLKNLRNKLS